MSDLANLPLGARRDQDIALDLMKFIALTTGIGKAAAPSAGFQGGTASRVEDHADQLLHLYGRCLSAVQDSAKR
jgi:hypothetical protein